MTHFCDDGIPHVWRQLNEVHRTNALHVNRETPQVHAFAHTHTSTSCTLITQRAFLSLSEGFSKGAKFPAEVGVTEGLIDMANGGGYE
jgi:hypothetical protein